MHRFPPGTILNIQVVFPGEYRVGFKTNNRTYSPGFSSYYPLEEALDKAWQVFQNYTKAINKSMSTNYAIGLVDTEGQKLANQNGYVEVLPDQNFAVSLSNYSDRACSAQITINGDLMGTWILKAGQSSIIQNPDPAYATGVFKALAKDTTNWQAAGMDQVDKQDQGVVSVTFKAGLPVLNTHTQPKRITRNAWDDTYDVRSSSQDTSRGSLRSMSKGISSHTHQNAGIGLEGENVQEFGSASFTADPRLDPVILELRLVTAKPAPVIKPTRQQPNIFRPPAM